MKPGNKSFLFSLVCMLTATIIVIVLIAISEKKSSRKNGFTRNFISKKLIPVYQSEKIDGLRAICGLQYNHIYFETDTAGNIIETDSTLLNPRFIKFIFPGNELIQSLYTTLIDSSHYYIMAGNVPEEIQFDINTKSYQLYHFPKNLYSESVVLGNNNYIFRAYQKISGKWEQIFIKGNTLNKTVLTEQNISDKRGDAGFTTDGMLLFDDSTRLALYVEYYRNQFICMDTLLHLLYRSHTIDTFTNTTTEAAWNESQNFKSVTNGSPLHEVSLESRAVNGKLFIHSAVKADNESRKEFSDHSVLDMYRISDGHYISSFYIPEYKNQRLKDFDIIKNKIVVLYDSYVVIYSGMPNLYQDYSIYSKAYP